MKGRGVGGGVEFLQCAGVLGCAAVIDSKGNVCACVDESARDRPQETETPRDRDTERKDRGRRWEREGDMGGGERMRG